MDIEGDIMIYKWGRFRVENQLEWDRAKIILSVCIREPFKSYQELHIFGFFRYDTINNGKSIYYDY